MAAGGAHANWSSRFAFLMASVGFAVGLGNIWRFPYVAGENGGAAFVIIYLACAFFIGVPILMAELMVGRRGESSPPIAMAKVATSGWWSSITLGMTNPIPTSGSHWLLSKTFHCWIMSLASSSPAIFSASVREISAPFRQ